VVKVEDKMKNRRSTIQIYAALSLAILLALIGWRVLSIYAAVGEPIAPDPVDVDSNQGTNDQESVVDDPVVIDPGQSDPEPTPNLSDEELIRSALVEHFVMDESEFYRFEVEEIYDIYARGVVDNGYFLAVKLNDQWVFVAGGHSMPNCNDVAELGFPASMVPECAAAGSNMPDCPGVGTTVATFIKDVTIEDGSVVEPGQYFTKTWRIQNVGTCTWNADYQFVFDSGDRMGGAISRSLTVGHVPPGSMIDVSVQLRAPDESGSYRGYWRFLDSKGGDFGLTSGGSVWVDIKVEEDSSGEDSSADGYTGYPMIDILEVEGGQSVTIKVKNLPAQDKFNVMMNYYGTLGENGTIVDSFLTGDGGKITATFQIPDYLKDQASIAIRLESPYSGYYAYNWFINS
jgi:hypothetical protein